MDVRTIHSLAFALALSTTLIGALARAGAPQGDPHPDGCTLDAEALPARMAAIRALLAHRTDAQETDGGYTIRFPDSADIVDQVVTIIQAERVCCRFIAFHLIFPEREDSMQLEITGEGVKEMLAPMLVARSADR